MEWIEKILNILNENTGVTLIISALVFGANEWVKTRNIKKQNQFKLKAENIDVKSLEKEQELYKICSKFCLVTDVTEEVCIESQELIRNFIIDNDLFLREKLSKVGGKFADYIIEEASKGGKDVQKEKDLLKEFKKLFRA